MAKVVIVTGASRGIGAAIARMAGQRGYDVVVNFLRRADAADAVVADIQRAGQRALAIQADVAVEADVRRLFETADSEFGRLAALVNNAGIISNYGRVDALDANALAQNFATNVGSYFLCAGQAIRRMSTRRGGDGGSIVNVSSRAATVGMPGEYVHYAAAKGAVDTMTRGLAIEVAAEGIRVNAVSPGLIDTDIQIPERLARLAPTVPIGRAGRPEEVAEAVIWLISPSASYVIGANIAVTGGR
jgi:NAD(P)-dependent dehydrogenase (short-subunit alcohol dehydrogenase family)